jgi:hypothetical protein
MSSAETDFGANAIVGVILAIRLRRLNVCMEGQCVSLPEGAHHFLIDVIEAFCMRGMLTFINQKELL